ncbi:hypothetical protein CFOL_v3_24708 [Cephalotus follicularis]|uniref:Uncharacterized protein n=1 Tax=Cephalotus follicularis TaxID=3775 RepID=A0A1Q3CLX0_CEPFO|nr:hypothetical protein CFOL_v3_24708 [Cephalotus follicularis]
MLYLFFLLLKTGFYIKRKKKENPFLFFLSFVFILLSRRHPLSLSLSPLFSPSLSLSSPSPQLLVETQLTANKCGLEHHRLYSQKPKNLLPKRRRATTHDSKQVPNRERQD